VSRHKLSRSQKFVTVQDFDCGQMRVSGCKNHYKSVLGAGAKAKSVTNNLPILSVLAQVCDDQLDKIVISRIFVIVNCVRSL